MKYYLGIDGGGTKTVAAVSDENGKILLKKTGKTINFYSVGMDTARFNLETILVEIDAVSGINQFESVFIGCSALDSEADEELTAKLCSGIVNAKKIRMNSDAYIALKSVQNAKCPCVAISGTGSMAVAEDEKGNTRITGGWGHIIGDEGSAYGIAIEVLKKCCIMCDKNDNSPLIASAKSFFGVDCFRKSIDIIYSSETTKDVIASFSVKVGELASSGDEDALKIVRSQAELFAATVSILLEKIKKCDVLGLYGGMFLHNEIFANAFSEKIKAVYPSINIKLIDTPPEESAVRLAREL